jgi:hypothetical protein
MFLLVTFYFAVQLVVWQLKFQIIRQDKANAATINKKQNWE